MSSHESLPAVEPACNEDATEYKVRRCILGAWVEGWTSSAPGVATVAAPVKPCGTAAPTNAFDAVSHAIRQGWTPGAVADLVKSLK